MEEEQEDHDPDAEWRVLPSSRFYLARSSQEQMEAAFQFQEIQMEIGCKGAERRHWAMIKSKTGPLCFWHKSGSIVLPWSGTEVRNSAEERETMKRIKIQKEHDPGAEWWGILNLSVLYDRWRQSFTFLWRLYWIVDMGGDQISLLVTYLLSVHMYSQWQKTGMWQVLYISHNSKNEALRVSVNNKEICCFDKEKRFPEVVKNQSRNFWSLLK